MQQRHSNIYWLLAYSKEFIKLILLAVYAEHAKLLHLCIVEPYDAVNSVIDTPKFNQTAQRIANLSMAKGDTRLT